MPITSTQVSGIVSGQQAMFGNAATYAAQISPYTPSGASPTYSNPMAGAGYPSAMAGASSFNSGQQMAGSMISGATSIGLPLMGGAGMMMGGAAGGLMDPFTGALRGFGRGIGMQAGSGMSGAMSAMGRAGVGGIARGLGFAAAGALPALALGAAASYTGGQMLEGAQFQGNVNSYLQNNFRHTNAASRTGYGFDTHQQRGIGQMLQSMGTEDAMSTPQEMLRVMQRGTDIGVFRGVREAKEFRERFKKMTDSLKEIARTFNTTLEDAMPFFNEARKQGFWTPQDIMQHSRQIRHMQSTTGMSASQAQSMTGMGAQMVRSIGGTGQQGAAMMARAQSMTGAALAGGVITSQQLQEAGMGSGAEGAQNLGNMFAGDSARFARSRVGRWVLAASMNKEGTGLDPERLRQLSEGGMSIGRIGSMARRNVSGGRAYDFVQNEEKMRGQLAENGGVMGLARGMIGDRLHSDSSRDQLITRRIIKRLMGGTNRMADLRAQVMRDMPQIQKMEEAQSETSLDAQSRQQQDALQNTFEGFKRRVGRFWKENVTGPMQETGADFSQRVGRAWQRFQDKLFNTMGKSVHLQKEAVRALSVAAETGDMSALRTQFAGKDLTTQTFGDSLSGPVSVRNEGFMDAMGFKASGERTTLTGRILQGMETLPMVGWAAGAAGALGIGSEGTYSQDQAEAANSLHRGMSGIVGSKEASALGFGSEDEMKRAQSGAGAKGIQKFLRSSEALSMRGRMGSSMDDGDKAKLAKQYLARIRQGGAGDEAKDLVAGLSTDQAIGRVLSVQGSARGGYTGITMEGPGVEGVSSHNTRSELEKASEGARWQLATQFLDASGQSKGGIKGEAVTEDGLRELEKDSRAAEAFNLFSRAKQDNDPELMSQARRLMKEVGLDKENGLSESARSAAIKLADGKDPRAKQLAEAAGKVGDVKRIINTKEFQERSANRMKRMRSVLGTDKMGSLRAAAGKGGMEETLRDLVDNASTISPKERLEKIKDLARSAADDPEAAGKMMDIIGDAPGGGELRLALQGGRKLSEMLKKGSVEGADETSIETGTAGKKVTDRARRGVRGLLGQYDISKGVSNKEIDKILKGDDSEKLRGILGNRKWSEDKIDEFMKDAEGGLTREEMSRLGAGAAAGRALQSYDRDVAKETGLKPGSIELTGQEGSPTEMGVQLKIQTGLLKDIAISAAKSAEREDSITKTPPSK